MGKLKTQFQKDVYAIIQDYNSLKISWKELALRLENLCLATQNQLSEVQTDQLDKWVKVTYYWRALDGKVLIPSIDRFGHFSRSYVKEGKLMDDISINEVLQNKL